MKTEILVPVSSFEPLSVVKKSVESLSMLDGAGRITYIVDTNEKDERVSFLEKCKVNLVLRNTNRGRRGGAINDALKEVSADYIAIFDVDSRPERSFIAECVKLIGNDVVIASGGRYITNKNYSPITRIVSAEYEIIRDIYRIFHWCDGFKQFNGLIGVIDGRTLKEKGLREDKICEDVDFTQRIYLDGKTAAFTKKVLVGEQAPITLRDFYHQRVRWMRGALEGLEEHFSNFLSARIPRSRKITWFMSMTIPFFLIFLSPLVPLCSVRLWRSRRDVWDFLIKFFGLILYTGIMEICGITAILTSWKRKMRWKKIERTEV
ncbi:MAG: glycosyltransferase family 2 protein [Candidatus Syntropharchaeia archaeon]